LFYVLSVLGISPLVIWLVSLQAWIIGAGFNR
jgi:hypothetical protein